MRTTVGPLPSAVYWRRRAVVLGALLLGVMVLFISCSGEDPAKQPGVGSGTPASNSGVNVQASAQASPGEIEPSFEDAEPGGGPALPDPSDAAAGPAVGASGAPAVTVAVPAGGAACADAEMAVSPVPGRTAARRGTPVELRLKIKNVSARICSRDVGADLQEIYLKQGARKVWSSDICSTAKGSKVEQFTPNFEREYRVTWNGRMATKCAGGAAAGPAPLAGEYQILGRLGGKVSAPVRFVVVA